MAQSEKKANQTNLEKGVRVHIFTATYLGCMGRAGAYPDPCPKVA